VSVPVARLLVTGHHEVTTQAYRQDWRLQKQRWGQVIHFTAQAGILIFALLLRTFFMNLMNLMNPTYGAVYGIAYAE
jgi:hypothetical protein